MYFVFCNCVYGHTPKYILCIKLSPYSLDSRNVFFVLVFILFVSLFLWNTLAMITHTRVPFRVPRRQHIEKSVRQWCTFTFTLYSLIHRSSFLQTMTPFTTHYFLRNMPPTRAHESTKVAAPLFKHLCCDVIIHRSNNTQKHSLWNPRRQSIEKQRRTSSFTFIFTLTHWCIHFRNHNTIQNPISKNMPLTSANCNKPTIVGRPLFDLSLFLIQFVDVTCL